MTDNGTSTNSHGGRDGGDLAAETIAQALPYCRTCRRALNVEVSPAGTVRLRRPARARTAQAHRPCPKKLRPEPVRPHENKSA